MKEDELRQYADCGLCGKPIGASGVPMFWRVSVERFVLDMAALQRQQGLSMVLGSAQLAGVMGPNEDLAKPVMDKITMAVCEDCATGRDIMIAMLADDE